MLGFGRNGESRDLNRRGSGSRSPPRQARLVRPDIFIDDFLPSPRRHKRPRLVSLVCRSCASISWVRQELSQLAQVEQITASNRYLGGSAFSTRVEQNHLQTLHENGIIASPGVDASRHEESRGRDASADLVTAMADRFESVANKISDDLFAHVPVHIRDQRWTRIIRDLLARTWWKVISAHMLGIL